MVVHARLSPSSSSRWMKCPGSVPLTASLPPETESSSFALEGTAAHFFAARVLQSKCETGEISEQSFVFEGKKFVAGDDLELDAIDFYVRYVRSQMLSKAAKLFVEAPLPIGIITGENGALGTPDAAVYSPDSNELIIVDFKYGAGVLVSAQDNTQLLLYGLTFWKLHYENDPSINQLRLVIVQPRSTQKIDEFIIPASDFLKHCGRIKKAVIQCASATLAALDHGPRKISSHYFSPGEKQCKWCQGKAICPALGNMVTEAIQAVPDSLDDEVYLSRSYEKITLIEKWVDAIRSAVFSRLVNGESVAGYKIVRGRSGNRKWNDEAAVLALAAGAGIPDEKITNINLITPAEMERRAGKSLISKEFWGQVSTFVSQSDGKPTVVAADDPRPSLTSISVEFENLE